MIAKTIRNESLFQIEVRYEILFIQDHPQEILWVKFLARIELPWRNFPECGGGGIFT